MKYLTFVFCSILALSQAVQSVDRRFTKHLRPVVEKRQQPEPIEGTKGALIEEGSNIEIDLQNPDALRPPPTDGGNVVNLKWSFSLSKQRLFNGGFIREQVVTDLPPSTDISAAQNHLKKGAIRGLHWHRVAEWGLVTSGTVLVSAVDDLGRNTVFNATEGDIWYFPKGEAHAIQGIEDSNEYLLVFDDGDFDAVGTTFNVDDWITHTPADILRRNFGLNSSNTFKNTPSPDPGIQNGVVSNGHIDSPFGKLIGNNSYFFPGSKTPPKQAPGGGGTLKVVDTSNFPISETIAAVIVEVNPGGLREMHWHPNAAEWLYFRKGQARATVWIGGSNARTFDFQEGDTAVFPDNSGHYIENLSKTESLSYVEIYRSDRVRDFSLTQWLALTPPDIVAHVLNVSMDFVLQLKKEKQSIIA